MTKLVLNVGDRVRNIRVESAYFKEEGKVQNVKAHGYTIVHDSGAILHYGKTNAHKTLSVLKK